MYGSRFRCADIYNRITALFRSEPATLEALLPQVGYLYSEIGRWMDLYRYT